MSFSSGDGGAPLGGDGGPGAPPTAPPPTAPPPAAPPTSASAALRGYVCGVAFGVASPLAAHPLDTLKTRMQASPECARGGALAALRATVRAGGARALWRGLLPPLVGSAFYRSSQMGAYAGAHTALADVAWARAAVPLSGGTEVRVLLAGAAATTARAAIEAPLEALKVRAQCGAPPPTSACELLRGAGLTWARLYVALGSFFVLTDAAERHAPGAFAAPVVGPFLKGGVAATAGWWLAWPLEVAKNRVQSGLRGERTARAALAGALRDGGGWRGLYRGLGPGTLRSLVGNGAAVLAFETCQKCLPAV